MSAKPRQCRNCQHCGRYGTCLEPEAAGLWHTFVIVWPPEGYARTCQAWKQRGAA